MVWVFTTEGPCVDHIFAVATSRFNFFPRLRLGRNINLLAIDWLDFLCFSQRRLLPDCLLELKLPADAAAESESKLWRQTNF